MIRKSSTESSVSAALARDRLGVPSVVYFVLAGVGPLMVVAGLVTTAYAATGLTGIPAAFLIVAVVLAVFSVGYVAMARYISNAGAFYAFISKGLGRPVGVGASLIAVVAYNLLQVALYGMFGPTMSSFIEDNFKTSVPWWVCALGAWVVVTILGLIRVDLSGKVLGALLTCELLVVIALSVSGLSKPYHHHLSFATLSPSHLTAGGLGAVLAIAVLGYIGFEQSPVFAEEARDPRRTVPLATYLSLGLIAIVYAGASWAMAASYGDTNVVTTAQQQSATMFFSLGDGFLYHAGNVLFLTSLFAAALAFHNAVWRYMFALGREHVLPAALGRTGRTGVPKTASAVQSALGFVFIIVFAATGWDPILKMFYWLGTTGGFGILVLIAVTSIAVVCYFWREPQSEPLWRRLIAPAIATLALLGMVWACADHYSTLLDVQAGSLSAKLLPGMFLVAAAIGIVWALMLKRSRPEVYAVIGQGANSAISRATAVPAAPAAPAVEQVEEVGESA